jgi:hypothetical protein
VTIKPAKYEMTMNYIIPMKSREQYVAALDVLFDLPGTWHCRGTPESPVLIVAEPHLKALVKAGVVSVNGKKGNARGKKTAKKSKP